MDRGWGPHAYPTFQGFPLLGVRLRIEEACAYLKIHALLFRRELLEISNALKTSAHLASCPHCCDECVAAVFLPLAYIHLAYHRRLEVAQPLHVPVRGALAPNNPLSASSLNIFSISSTQCLLRLQRYCQACISAHRKYPRTGLSLVGKWNVSALRRGRATLRVLLC